MAFSADDTQLLQVVADGGQMDYAVWPQLLPRVTSRLDEIVRTQFPLPQLPQHNKSSPAPSPPRLRSTNEPTVSQTSTPSRSTRNGESQPSDTWLTSDTTPVEIPDGTLPPQILAALVEINATLNRYFTTYPPHTIQRLSELLLTPRRHFRTLPAYLHAVDRIVHVTSGANIYPLPTHTVASAPLINGTSAASNGANPGSVSWGAATTASHAASDNNLGGALLTPIPWLRPPSMMGMNVEDMDGHVQSESTEMIDGPLGPGGVETVTVSVNGISSASPRFDSFQNGHLHVQTDSISGDLRAEGGVTQGELLRQEQQAGVVPALQLGTPHRLAGDGDGDGNDDEVPHARGPQDVGMEDMGPQGPTHSSIQGMHGIDVEAAVGRRAEVLDTDGTREDVENNEKAEAEGEADYVFVSKPKREADADLERDAKKIKEDEETPAASADEDMILVDADGRAQDESKVGERGENKGGDACDTTVV